MVEVKKAGSLLGREVFPEQEYYCPKHGKYTGIPVKFDFVNHIIDPQCPKCLEEDKVKEKEADRKRNTEESENRRIQRLTALNIGKINWENTFENFDAYTPELKHHLAICRDFANDPNGRKIVMLGNNGTGKNHLASAILKTTGGLLRKIMEIELLIRQSYSGNTQEYPIIKELCDVEMLVIDEIGRTKGGDWEQNWLSYIIDKRHENLMPMVLISNKHLKEDCTKEDGCTDCIQNYIGNDVISRIHENGIILNFTGEDYRYHLREIRKGEPK
jgi:DNA replication protein DnaC